MKSYILVFAALLFSCGSAVDPHAGHDHSATETTEAHENHDSHEGHDHTQGEHDAHTEGGQTAEASNEIVLTDAQLKVYNIQSEEVTPSAFNSVIRAAGKILPAAGDVSLVAATADGIVAVDGSSLTLGRAVSKGEALFTISSRTLPTGEQSSRTRATYEKARREYERAVELAKDKIVSQKELEATELAYREAKIAYEAQSGEVSARGVMVKAPISGFLTSIDVQNGSYVAVGQQMATVSQNRRLVIRTDVPSKYFRELPAVTAANFRSAYSDELHSTRALNGRKIAINNNVTGGSNYLTVDFEIDNRGELIPGSLVESYLISGERQNIISVPVASVLEKQGHKYVMIRLDEECFEEREVKTGASNGERIELTSGVKAGENVVTNGAYQVRMAAASTAIPDGHNH